MGRLSNYRKFGSGGDTKENPLTKVPAKQFRD